MIASGKGREPMEEYLQRPGSDFVSLRDNALRLVETGQTTSSEVVRVVYEDI